MLSGPCSATKDDKPIELDCCGTTCKRFFDLLCPDSGIRFNCKHLVHGLIDLSLKFECPSIIASMTESLTRTDLTGKDYYPSPWTHFLLAVKIDSRVAAQCAIRRFQGFDSWH